MSSFSQKIDEWMKEAETRPESAVTIVRLVSRRLVELTARNDSTTSGISSAPFLEYALKTVEFRIKVSCNDDDTWSYE